MPLSQMADFTRKVIRSYPNTQVYSKALTEQLILDRVEAMRKREASTGKQAYAVSIIRPSILGAICNEPIPGWLDGVSSTLGLAIYTGLGALDSSKGNSTFSDLVPVDFVANTIIRACAGLAPPGTQFNLPILGSDEETYPKIFHTASSAINPLTWDQLGHRLLDSWKKLPFPRRAAFPPAFQRYSSKLQYDTLVYLKQQYRFSVISLLLSLDDTFRLRQLRSKLFFLYHCSAHFSTNSWRFLAHNLQQLEASQSQRHDIISSRLDSKAFRLIPWRRYLGQFMYGLAQFVLHEPPIVVRPQLMQGWTCLLRQPAIPTTPDDEIDDILSHYYDFQLTWGELNGLSLAKDLLVDSEVKAWCTRFPSLGPKLCKILTSSESLLGKLCRERGFGEDTLEHIHRGLLGSCRTLQIQQPRVERLREHISRNPKTRIIYLPTHNSNVDYAVLTFALSRCALPVPVVAAEASSRVLGYRESHGGLVGRDLFGSLPEFPTHRHLHHILKLNGSVAIFLDDAPHALPNGVLTPSAQFPAILRGSSICDSSFLANDYLHRVLKGLIDDKIPLDSVTLVPVSINYEKFPDSSRLAQLWAGSGRWSEGMPVQEEGAGPRGRIYVAFGNPVGLDRLEAQAAQLRSLDLDAHAQALPNHLIRTCQHQGQLVSPTALMALVVSAHRRSSKLSFPRARSLLSKLRTEAEAKNFHVDWRDDEDPSAILSYTLSTLGPEIITLESGATTHICLCPGEDAAFQLHMLVSQAHHLFAPDAVWIASYHWSRALDGDLPVLATIQRNYNFICELVQAYHPSLQAKDFPIVTRRMEKAGWFHVSGTEAVIITANPSVQDFLSCIFAILHPAMEGLWHLTQVLEESLQDPWDITSLIAAVQRSIRDSSSPYVETAAAPEIHRALVSLASLGILKVTDSTATLFPMGLSDLHSQFLERNFPQLKPNTLLPRESPTLPVRNSSHLRLIMRSIDPSRVPEMTPTSPPESLPELISEGSSRSTEVFTAPFTNSPTPYASSPLMAGTMLYDPPKELSPFSSTLFQRARLLLLLPKHIKYHLPRLKQMLTPPPLCHRLA
ncbi:hypothetical protein DSO57_1002566 [Entomophthora muscae]|uniref:Uncharacterized protein n=1 Tax=Entomophthora muscae TaxID=34485 RepID=A0ACC2U7C6_9FUNG|nr:hypothetical protein DSO57_1002566 [Entomophthora muscae]